MQHELITWRQIPEVLEDALQAGDFEEALQHYLTLRSKYKRIYDISESAECYTLLTEYYNQLQEVRKQPVAEKPVYALLHKSWTKARAIAVVVIIVLLVISLIVALL